jgi:acetyl esterase/lipase
MPTVIRYGEHAAQFGELSRPVGPARDTVVIIHGGFWRAAYTLDLGRPLAADLVARGYVAWNIEYRRMDDGGGWPATFADVAAAIDVLADADVDTNRVVAVGHSAGGHLAVWAAGRSGLPLDAPGASPAVTLAAAVSQAGVLDLRTAHRLGLSRSAVAELLGGSPTEVPQRYALADPIARVAAPIPVLCVHSPHDDTVPIAQSRVYVAAAIAAGATATLVETAGDHMSVIDPAGPQWRVVLDALPRLIAAGDVRSEPPQ